MKAQKVNKRNQFKLNHQKQEEMLQEKLEQLVAVLEKQELEDTIHDPKLYDELFAAYLFLDDL